MRTLRPAAEPITEDDAFLARALESASIPTLMMSLVHLTGDTSLLRGSIRPAAAIMGEVQGSLSDEEKATVRARALAELAAYRDRGCTLPPQPTPEIVHEMMSFVVGQPVPDEYLPMMMEEMALDGEDARAAPAAADVPRERKQRFPVLVIGAGMSGILAAIRLQDAGLPFVVVEKNDRVGGTWYENTYPGCRVDIANHFYCYSFEPNHDWPEFFSQQGELLAYFERVACKHGLLDRIRFGTEVVSLRWDEDAAEWEAVLRQGEAEERLRVKAVISAVGQLNRPKRPAIPGLDTFAGPAFHSAAWRHDVPLEGRRVAVIGTGASALQIVPEVAKVAGELRVFQRSPAWMVPNAHYHRRVSEGKKWLFRHVPYYARWYRFLLFWPGSDGLLPSLVVDPEWPHPERSVNALNDQMRVLFTEYMKSQVGDDPELLEKVVPRYPPFGKRMLQDNGSWLGALRRDNVELVTDPIVEITRDAIVCEGGSRHVVDVIVLATGFHANEFLWPMEVVGRGGVDLRALWQDDPRAYLGITVPGFPNLFCLYGPGTNLAHAGSIIFHSECQVRYAMGCVAALLEHGLDAMECRRDVFDAWNRRFDETMERMVWQHPGMDSWYKNRHGHVRTTSPWRLVDYWDWTREPRLADYELW